MFGPTGPAFHLVAVLKQSGSEISGKITDGLAVDGM